MVMYMIGVSQNLNVSGNASRNQAAGKETHSSLLHPQEKKKKFSQQKEIKVTFYPKTSKVVSEGAV